MFSDFRSKNLTKNVCQSKHLQVWIPRTSIFTNFFLSCTWSQIGALDVLELPGDGFYAGFGFPVVHLGIPKNHIKGFWAYLDNANFRFMSQLSNRPNIRKLRTKKCTELGFRPNPELCTHARFATFVLRFELFWSPKMDNWEPQIPLLVLVG